MEQPAPVAVVEVVAVGFPVVQERKTMSGMTT
jgi:hypothetical protein